MTTFLKKTLLGFVTAAVLLQSFSVITFAEDMALYEAVLEETDPAETVPEEAVIEAELQTGPMEPETVAETPAEAEEDLLKLYDREDGLVVFSETLPVAQQREAQAEDELTLMGAAYTPSPVGSENHVSGIKINHQVRWTGMDAWWEKNNGLITFSKDWSRFYANRISQLHPGDVIEWKDDKAYGGLYTNHIAIVTDVADDNSYFVTADGNAGGSTGIQFLYHYDLTKGRSSGGVVNIWRNAKKATYIANSVRIFALKMINNNDRSMLEYYWNKLGINWCYCFVVEALLQVNINGKYYDTPVLKACNSNEGGISLKWSKVDGAEVYRVYCKNPESDSWKLLDREVAGNTFQYTAAEPGIPYVFSVAASGEYGVSNKSKENLTGALLAGTTARVTRVNRAVKVTWETVPSAQGYAIFRQADGGSWKKVGTSFGTSFRDTSYKEGAVNQYLVRPFVYCDKEYCYGHLDKSSQTAGVEIPEEPVIRKITSARKTQIITWKPVNSASGYTVYRKEKGKNWKKIGFVTDAASFTDKKVKAGIKYVYSVSSINSKNAESDHFDKTAAGYFVPPAKLKKIRAVSGGVQLTWNKSDTATGYCVYRRVPGGKWKKIKTVGKATTYVDKKGKAGKVYEYLVRAVNLKSGVYYFSVYNENYSMQLRYPG